MTQPSVRNPSIPALAHDKRTGYVLMGLALVIALSALNEGVSAFLWLGAIALGFLVAHRRTHNPGFAVPGGVMAGIAFGALLEGILPLDGVFLLGFAGGFWLVQMLEPRYHAWAQYPAWVFTALGALIVLSANAWVVALGLVAAGVYLIRRQERNVAAQEIVPVPTTSALERLQGWRRTTAQRAGVPEAEILRTEQLERLSTLHPENVDAMFGVLDTAQIEKHGKALLEILRSA